MRFELLTQPQGPVLAAFRACDWQRVFIMGPVGSGKTNECIQKVMMKIITQAPYKGVRRSRWMAVRNTYSDLKTTTIKDWLAIFGDLGEFKKGGSEPPYQTLRFKLEDGTKVESEIIFIALDRPESIKKLKGTNITGFWLNEACELAKEVIDDADLRAGRYPHPWEGGAYWRGLIGDTNPPDTESWYYDYAEVSKPEGWAFFRQPGGLMREMRLLDDGRQEWTGKWIPDPGAENLQNLPEGYYDRGQAGKSNFYIANRLANEYGKVFSGRPVYLEQWNSLLHVDDKIEFIEDRPLVIGLDFGLTPSAIIGQETVRGRVIILDELVSEGKGINQFVTEDLMPLLNQRYRGASEMIFIGDPAGDQKEQTDENTVFKELASLGIDALAANTNDTMIRWEAVRWYLQQLRDGKPAFAVHPRCQVLIKGFEGGYQFKTITASGSSFRHNEQAEKNKYSHPHDAGQYLAMYFRGLFLAPKSTFTRKKSTRRSAWA